MVALYHYLEFMGFVAVFVYIERMLLAGCVRQILFGRKNAQLSSKDRSVCSCLGRKIRVVRSVSGVRSARVCVNCI